MTPLSALETLEIMPPKKSPRKSKRPALPGTPVKALLQASAAEEAAVCPICLEVIVDDGEGTHTNALTA